MLTKNFYYYVPWHKIVLNHGLFSYCPHLSQGELRIRDWSDFLPLEICWVVIWQLRSCSCSGSCSGSGRHQALGGASVTQTNTVYAGTATVGLPFRVLERMSYWILSLQSNFCQRARPARPASLAGRSRWPQACPRRCRTPPAYQLPGRSTVLLLKMNHQAFGRLTIYFPVQLRLKTRETSF